jgi:hypothetical protein
MSDAGGADPQRGRTNILVVPRLRAPPGVDEFAG